MSCSAGHDDSLQLLAAVSSILWTQRSSSGDAWTPKLTLMLLTGWVLLCWLLKQNLAQICFCQIFLVACPLVTTQQATHVLQSTV